MKGSLVLLCVICCLLIASDASAQWILGPVDTLTSNEVMDQNGPEALAIDSSGTLHVVWRQEVADSSWRILYISKESEGDWSSPVEIPSLFPNNGIPAMEVEYSTGIAHVVWHGLDTLDDDKEIFYATNESGSWETIALTSDTTDDCDPTTTLDGLGNVHMAWIGIDTVSSELKMEYATDLSGVMALQVMEESQPEECPYWCYHGPPSIAVSLDGVAHIAYFGSALPGVDWSMHHVENDMPGGADWSDEAMETDAVNYDEYSSIAVDGDGDLHLVICGQLGGPGECCYRTLYFHRSAGSVEWDSAQLVYQQYWLEKVVLELDGTGRIHVLAATGTDNGYSSYSLMYSTNASDDWHTHYLIHGEYRLYHTPSFVIDRSDYGHAVFYNTTVLYHDRPREILYSRSAEPLWPKSEFVRGDVDSDGSVEAQDFFYLLKYLYVPGTETPSCLDAVDCDDDGSLSMADAIRLLKWLYIPGGVPPPPPFPDCGVDPTWDGKLGCGSYLPCE